MEDKDEANEEDDAIDEGLQVLLMFRVFVWSVGFAFLPVS